MDKTHETIEIWVIVDEDGNYVASDVGSDEAHKAYDDAYGDERRSNRSFKLQLKVKLPTAVTINAEIPDTQPIKPLQLTVVQ